MAPIDTKRVLEQAEEGEAKRTKVEDEVEEEEESSDEEDFDAEDFDEDDDEDGDMDAEGFQKEDFEGVEMTDEMLEKFSEAYEKFQEYCSTLDTDEKSTLVFTAPQSVRPVPQTFEEMKENIPVLLVDNAHMAQVEKVKEQVMEAFEEMELPEDDEEITEEVEKEELTKVVVKQAQLMSAEVAALAAKAEKKEFDGLWSNAMCLTQIIFDHEGGHQCFTDIALEDGKALVAATGAMWKAVFAASDDDLKITADYRKHTIQFLTECKEDLQKGTFNGLMGALMQEEDDIENPFKEVSFDFQ